MTIKAKIICFSTAAAALLSCSGCVLDGTHIGINTETDNINNNSASIYTIDNSVTENINSIETSQIIDYYTSTLAENERKVFNEIYSGIMAYQKDIEITNGVIDKESIGDFLTFLTSVCSEIHHLSGDYGLYTDSNGYVTGLEMNYSRSKDQGDNELKTLNEEISQICEKTLLLSDYDKVKYFHDRIAGKCNYSTNGNNIYSAYGCLIENVAVCEGYSKAFALLCNKSGIPCINIMGEASDENGKLQSHMWNMVKLDSKWYHIDVTWDDPKNAFGDDYIRYDYFNVNDEMIKSDHTPIANRYMDYPKADSIDENYFIKQGLFLFDNSDNTEMIKYAINDCLNDMGKYIRFRCESEEKYQSVIKEMFSDEDNHSGFFSLLEEAVNESGASVSFEEYSLVENNATKVITIKLKSK